MEVEFPPKLQMLFVPSRYKCLHGGRGGAKSWGIARALLLKGSQGALRVLCARELQNSISESVHKLLSDQIDALGLNGLYVIEKARIYAPMTGTEFFFEGIRNNINKIKSYEGIDVCWVEEAQSVSKNSWDVLIPTIRKPSSEIWISFNPELEEDETYQRFVKNPPPNCITVKITWRDNPWFPEVLQQEMENLKAKDYDSYLHVWEGYPRVNLDGAIYAKELRAVMGEGRITAVPYDKSFTVSTYWDLGRSDSTSIWFVQRAAFEFRIIDYYENSGFAIDHYIEVLQNRHYILGNVYLPHDAKAKSIGTKRSVEEQMRAVFPGRVKIVPKLSVSDGISATRQIFNRCYFDSKKTPIGLKRLRGYKYAVVPGTTTFSTNPVHDENSHGADAFRMLGVMSKDPAPERSGLAELRKTIADSSRAFRRPDEPRATSGLGWMRGR